MPAQPTSLRFTEEDYALLMKLEADMGVGRMDVIRVALRLLARAWELAPPREVAIIGAPEDPRTRALLQACWQAYVPERILAAGGMDGESGPIALLRGKAAVGGSANVLDLDTTATALIHGGADVRASQGVNVQAEQTTQIVSVAEAGGQSDNVGVEGAVGVHLIKQRTDAGIDDDARLQAGGPVTVQANGDLEDITVAGGVVATKGQVGIGFAVSVNQVDTDTKAIIGNVDAAGAEEAGVQGAGARGGAETGSASMGTEVGGDRVRGAGGPLGGGFPGRRRLRRGAAGRRRRRARLHRGRPQTCVCPNG